MDIKTEILVLKHDWRITLDAVKAMEEQIARLERVVNKPKRVYMKSDDPRIKQAKDMYNSRMYKISHIMKTCNMPRSSFYRYVTKVDGQ